MYHDVGRFHARAHIFQDGADVKLDPNVLHVTEEVERRLQDRQVMLRNMRLQVLSPLTKAEARALPHERVVVPRHRNDGREDRIQLFRHLLLAGLGRAGLRVKGKGKG